MHSSKPSIIVESLLLIDFLMLLQKKAKASHAMLERFNPNLEKFGPVCELPLYNQPSDTYLYHTIKRR